MLIRVSLFYVNVFIQYTWFIFIKKKGRIRHLCGERVYKTDGKI